MTLSESSTTDAPLDKVDRVFAGLIEKNRPGAAVFVIHNGRAIFRGYGVAELRTLAPIGPKTSFRLASVTKQFTAMAIMLLVHDGKLSYDDPLTSIFPEYPDYGRKITIRNLLNHTSGLEDYEDLMPASDPTLPIETTQIHDREALELLKRQTTTKFSPGTRWAYSNSGYVLLGIIVEKASGKSFPDFLHDRIFEPLGMKNTVAYVRGANEAPNRAFGHSREGNGWKQTDQSPTSATLGDGGVYSSVKDLGKWDAALRQHTLLSEQEMKPAWTPVQVPEGTATEPDGARAAYGFGWFLNPYRGHARTWHYGETVGFRTAIQRFVNDQLTVIVLCNRGDLDASALTLRVSDSFLNSKE
jgi:CubicO group peptidase (beta-lactamase class C family)